MSEFLAYTLGRLDLVISDPERALLCRQCKLALRVDVDAICEHVTDRHSANEQTRRHVTQLLHRVELTNVSSLRPRPDQSVEDEHLRTLHGIICLLCSHRTSSAQTHWRHLSAQHKVNKEHATPGVHFASALLQCWTHGGPTSRQLWTVTPRPVQWGGVPQVRERIEENMRASLVATKRGRKRKRRDTERQQELRAAPLPDFLQNILEDERQRQKAPSARMNIPDNTLIDQALTSPWMQRTQWHRTYGQVRREVLIKLTDTPSRSTCQDGLLLGQVGSGPVWSCAADELRLARVTQALHQMFDRCEQTVHHTARPILCWLRSRSRGQPYKLPFQLVGHESTRRRYRLTWLRIILACLRYVRLDVGPGSIELGVPLSSKLRDILQQVWLAAASPMGDLARGPAMPGEENGVDECYSDSEDGIGSDSDDGLDTTVEEEALPHVTVDQPGDGDSSAPAFIRSGLPANHERSEEQPYVREGFEPSPNRGTDAQLWNNDDDADDAHGDRLPELLFLLSITLCLEECSDGRPYSSTLMYFSGVLGFTQGGVGFHRPRLYTPMLSALIHQQVLLFLEYSLPYRRYSFLRWPGRPARHHLVLLNRIRHRYMCFGSLSPLGEMMSLAKSGRELLRADGPRYLFCWSDDGQSVSFAGHRLHLNHIRQFANNLLASVRQLSNRLMCGWSPPFALHQIRDDICNTTPGYSFVHDDANGLQDAYLQLSERASLRWETALVSENGWDLSAVAEYLKVYESFVGVLMQIFFALLGQDPRVPELTSLEVTNGPYTQRGICVYNGRMVLITHHHKAKRSHNQEFHVGRYAPPAAEQDIFYCVVYFRPLVNMLLRRCFHVTEASNFLFVSNSISTREAQSRHMDTRELTHQLRRSTQECIGSAIGSQQLRQLIVAVTEKHISAIAGPLHQFDDRGANANMSVVLAWQSGHRPLQRGKSYGLDGAFPHTLQPKLLRLYEWASDQWHIFLGLRDPVQLLPSPWHGHHVALDPTPGTKLPETYGAPRPFTETHPLSLKPRTVLGEYPNPPSTMRVAAFGTSNGDNQWSITRLPGPEKSMALSPAGRSGHEFTRTYGGGVLPHAPSQMSEKPNLPTQATARFDFSAVFEHLPKHRIIVCRLCKNPFAVVPAQVDGHLKAHHPFIGRQERASIIKTVDKLDSLAHRTEDVVYPRPWDPAVPSLRVHADGLCCLGKDSTGKLCGKVLRTIINMQDHCKKSHGWVNQQRRGGYSRSKQKQTPNTMWKEGQRCQMFFRVAGWKRYFRIESAYIDAVE